LVISRRNKCVDKVYIAILLANQRKRVLLVCGAELKSGMAADELAGNLEKEPLRLVESEKVSCYYFRQVGILINSLWQPQAVVAIISLILSKRLLLIIL
jgi:hypothetical protein